MTDESDPITEAAKELVKQLPVKAVYKEGLSPAVKETGGMLADLMKTLRLVLAPIQALAVLQDRYRAFLELSVKRVPEEKRVPPPPQILGPVLEAIRYEPEDTPIDQMFSELLSRSMDSDRQGEAHPSYPIMIRQLSADEAKLLSLLADKQYEYVYTRQYDPKTNLFVGPQKVETDALPREGLSYPERVGFYFEHLDKLGLAGIYQVGNQEAIRDASGHQIGTRAICRYRLTTMGQDFMRACSPPER